MENNFEQNIPIYIQIMNKIKSDIVNKNLKPGDKLPSVRELSSALQVNPNTLQRAYNELEREGITYTQRGMGTYVKEDIDMINNLKNEMARNVIVNFIDGMKKLGFESKEILEVIHKEIEEEL